MDRDYTFTTETIRSFPRDKAVEILKDIYGKSDVVAAFWRRSNPLSFTDHYKEARAYFMEERENLAFDFPNAPLPELMGKQLENLGLSSSEITALVSQPVVNKDANGPVKNKNSILFGLTSTPNPSHKGAPINSEIIPPNQSGR